ncbi:MAG: PGPGW domain-containing protein, partial [Candidatus Nanopelagicales bacterium]
VLVIVAGSVLIIIGLALVVLPGPFTLPLVIAGVAVLSTEFAWASALLEEGQRRSKQLIRMLSNPWALMAVVILVGLAALAAYSWWRPGWWHTG